MEQFDRVVQPSRAEALVLPQLRLSGHPLVAHKLTLLRRTVTDVPLFRQIVAELTYLLSYEATADLPLATRSIETPLATMADLAQANFAMWTQMQEGLVSALKPRAGSPPPAL